MLPPDKRGAAVDYYTPKNRMPTELPILEIQVEHADGIEKTDPNGAVASALFGASGEDLNGKPGTAGLRMNIVRLAELSPVPGRSSVVSGEPALVYRAETVELALSPDEMHRFLDRSLTPDEYFAIRGRYGMFFEIHEDFYDPGTGEAFQPVTGEPLLRGGRPAPSGP